jgi:hypothetical protein
MLKPDGSLILTSEISQLNETSVGNVAFMAFHNPDSIWSKNYENIKSLIV